jgi:hypothetical protein
MDKSSNSAHEVRHTVQQLPGFRTRKCLMHEWFKHLDHCEQAKSLTIQIFIKIRKEGMD